jgi:hypothetical protein
MKKISLGLAAIALLAAGAAHAATTFDTTLASPDSSPATTNSTNPSWYNGSGNPQGAFTVTNDSGIELGLRAKLRCSPSLYNSATNTYVFATGTASGVALWNYEFSIDLNPGGAGTLTLADLVAASLTITDNGTGTSVTVNPLTKWVDDTGFGSVPGLTGAAKHIPETSADWGAQNSENLAFSDSPLSGDFNPWNADSYTFVLSVTLPGGTVVSDSMVVDTVPEPASMGLLGAGCVGLLGLRRKWTRKAIN